MSDVNINKSIEHMNESPIEDIEDGENFTKGGLRWEIAIANGG